MFSFLLAIIYVSFISLGLPDSLLGSAWPLMQTELGAPLSAAGWISMTISCCTIFSSLISDRVTRRFGTGLVTAVSVLLTAAALFGFSVSGSVLALILFAIPYGLGAGGVDAALNNYVALHYSSRHMSWLHCFWGVGASVSPYIMSYAISAKNSWETGYRTVSFIQIALTAVLFLTLSLWKKPTANNADEKAGGGVMNALKIPGVKAVLISFFCYCALETTAGLWASSFIISRHGISEERAASFASLFYLGITAGRFFNGFIADRFGDKTMIRIGCTVASAGICCILLPFGLTFTVIGLVITGLGCAPIYPSVIHSTPDHFGAENSQAIIGVQMASAYSGSLLMPPLFGIIAENTTVNLYPVYMLFFALLMFFMTETANIRTKKK
ncbi:MAG: MFS transporter [Ruminococcaceae bacterium]|nr:MFS transporter [Oscillospiraceae bacterium]